MSLAHNSILRGLNSIYLQAPHIPSSLVPSFLTYCQCWAESMSHHHHAEESFFFPEIERVTGEKGLMTRNVEQHEKFTPGFEKFDEYVKSKEALERFDGEEVRRLVE